jgi:hypothetical protein
MARGIYSALGCGPDAVLESVLAILAAFTAALDADGDAVATLPAGARAAGAIAVDAIRGFEARIGERCGAVAERVATPHGPAVELGNRGHRGFAAHEAAAAVVAATLADLLTALDLTGVFPFTFD